jgi:putative molybdopterin biosynthesis protein
LNRTPDPDPYLSPLEIAEELGLSDQTIYNWIREKKLPATKIGRALRIRRSDLERMIAAHSTTSAELGEDAFWDSPDAQGFQSPGRNR